MTGPTLTDLMRDPGVIDHSAADSRDLPMCCELDQPRDHSADDDDERRVACARKAAAKPRRSWLLKRGAR